MICNKKIVQIQIIDYEVVVVMKELYFMIKTGVVLEGNKVTIFIIILVLIDMNERNRF